MIDPDNIHEMVVLGNFERVKQLLQQHQNSNSLINAEDSQQRTPLHLASSMRSCLPMVQYFLTQAGANVEAKDNSGRTPLHAACGSFFETSIVVEYLVTQARGIDVNARDNDGKTPLHFASQNEGQHLDSIQCLVERGNADINARDKMGETPLFKAIKKGKRRVARYLIEEAEADVHVPNNFGNILLHEAASQNGSLDTVQYLIEKLPQTAINATNSLGWTALHQASQCGNLPVVKCLVEQGRTNLLIQDYKGDTALHRASQNKHAHVVYYLLQRMVAVLPQDTFLPLAPPKQTWWERLWNGMATGPNNNN